MRYERDNSMSRAFAIVGDRVRGLPEFAAARSEVIAAVIARIGGEHSVPRLRELGGFTKVVLDAIDALPAKYRVDYGSKMFPRTVADELAAIAPTLRQEAQAYFASLAHRRGLSQ